jgi:hypothetical protein
MSKNNLFNSKDLGNLFIKKKPKNKSENVWVINYWIKLEDALEKIDTNLNLYYAKIAVGLDQFEYIVVAAENEESAVAIYESLEKVDWEY